MWFENDVRAAVTAARRSPCWKALAALPALALAAPGVA
jgi:hypothetical protein